MVLRGCRARETLRYLPPYDPLEPRPVIAEPLSFGEPGLSRSGIIRSPASNRGTPCFAAALHTEVKQIECCRL